MAGDDGEAVGETRRFPAIAVISGEISRQWCSVDFMRVAALRLLFRRCSDDAWCEFEADDDGCTVALQSKRIGHDFGDVEEVHQVMKILITLFEEKRDLIFIRWSSNLNGSKFAVDSPSHVKNLMGELFLSEVLMAFHTSIRRTTPANKCIHGGASFYQLHPWDNCTQRFNLSAHYVKNASVGDKAVHRHGPFRIHTSRTIISICRHRCNGNI